MRRVVSTVGTTRAEKGCSPLRLPMGTGTYLGTRVDQCSSSSVTGLKKKSKQVASSPLSLGSLMVVASCMSISEKLRRWLPRVPPSSVTSTMSAPPKDQVTATKNMCSRISGMVRRGSLGTCSRKVSRRRQTETTWVMSWMGTTFFILRAPSTMGSTNLSKRPGRCAL